MDSAQLAMLIAQGRWNEMLKAMPPGMQAQPNKNKDIGRARESSAYTRDAPDQPMDFIKYLNDLFRPDNMVNNYADAMGGYTIEPGGEATGQTSSLERLLTLLGLTPSYAQAKKAAGQ